MKRSIRTRLFIMISLLVVCFVLLSWLVNSNFLERYYINHKKDQLLTNADQIASIYKGEPNDITLELERLESSSGITMIILDTNFALKYPNYNIDGLTIPNMNAMHGPHPLEGRLKAGIDYVKNNRALLDNKDVFALTKDNRLTINFLNLFTKLNNGDYLLLSTPLSEIQESAAIANRFFLFSGLMTIIIGLISAFIFARRFTRPIMGLNSIAQKMSQLDFSEKYPVTTDDEIGELGKSINSLSDQLDKAISDLTQANQKLQADIEYERSLDEMRKEFVSSVSHELKTPIALIQGYAEGLKLNVVEDEAGKNFYCEVITDEARKMNLMVRELLDLSQFESGMFKVDKQKFDILGLLEHILNKYQPIFQDKGVVLQFAKSENEDELIVDGDMMRIEQVLVNYINNALTYMDDQRQLQLSLRELENKVRISVYNSGNPIPEEARDKIFNSFYKVDKARSRAAGGSGLGLSIVRAIQEQHHNAYGVINREQGVEFWFEIDLADPQTIA
ncbi:MAG TPA: HAMP domain-containing sensor histidine kinase [Syntrophomonas sp.]|nr:HAMP domain-containing sensor histidine kinase [Syntrophomonas sp.]